MTETEREAESGRETETEPERVGQGETETERETESVSETERVTPIDTLAGLSSTHPSTEPNHGPATATVPHVLGLPA